MRKRNCVMILLVCLVMISSACSSSETSTETPSNNQDNDVTQNTDNQDNNETQSTDNQVNIPSDYPDERIEILVGYAAGGGTDTAARNIIKALKDDGIISQTITINSMPGATGAHALLELKKRRGDIYTLLMMPDFGEPIWTESIDAEITDFTQVAQVAIDSSIVAVSGDSPYQTIEELLDAMKAGEDVTIGLAGTVDSVEGLKWFELADSYGIENPKFVAFSGGSEALTAVLGGHVDTTLVNIGRGLDYLEDGSLRGLALTTEKRIKALPDIPTLVERGIDMTYERVRGLWAPADIPSEILEFWENTFKEMMEAETWPAYVDSGKMLLEFKGSEGYTKWTREEGPKFNEYFKNQQ
jgi:putative tricarboxylic transport membrane protein